MAKTEIDQFPIDRLRAALDGKRCVTAWLSYGDVFFLGFGDQVLPVVDAELEINRGFEQTQI